MPVSALWPRSRRERTLAARCLRLADTLRTQAVERERLARERDTAVWLLAEERYRLGTWAMDTARFLCPDCDPLRRELAAATRLLHAQADRLAVAQREIDGLHADIARMRPRLVEGRP